jgi:hypothetical protein
MASRKVVSSVAFLALIFWPLMVPRGVYACSAGDDFNPVESSEVVVAGYVTGWDEVSSPAGPPTYQPVRLTIQVDRMLKGAAQDFLYVYDVASLINQSQRQMSGHWAGGGGACGAFDADPKGKYVVLGLSRSSEDGSLRTNRLRTFFVGDKSELTGEREAEILGHLSRFGLIVPPSTGSGGLR